MADSYFDFWGGKKKLLLKLKNMYVFEWSPLEMCFFVDNCKLLFFLPKNVIIVMLKVPCCSKLNFCIVCNFMPKLLCSTYRKVVNSMRVKPRQALGKVIWVKSFTLCCPFYSQYLTLESGIDVDPWINVASGKFDKKNKAP